MALALTVKSGEGLLIGDYLVVAGPNRQLAVHAPKSVKVSRVSKEDLQRVIEERKIAVEEQPTQ